MGSFKSLSYVPPVDNIRCLGERLANKLAKKLAVAG